MKKLLSLILAGVLAASFAAVVSAEEIEPLAVNEQGVKTWLANAGYAGEGPDKLFDYNETTKWCHSDPWSYAVWEMPEAVSVTAYQIVTANDNAEYPGRNPGSWTLSGCNDYNVELDEGSWEEIHVVEGDTVLQDVNYTPFLFELEEAAPAYKFYMLEINEVVGGGTFQMSGFNLIYDGQAAQSVKSEEEILAEKKAAELQALYDQGYVDAVVLRTVEGINCVSGTEGFSDTEGPASLFFHNTSTKWCSGNGAPFEVVWEMPNAVAITGYQLATGGDTASYPGRNPKSWNLYGSADGNEWTVIDAVTDTTILLAANETRFDFNLAAAAPEYKFFKYEITAMPDDGTTMQLSEIGLIYDGAVAEEGEEVKPLETEAPETEPETDAPETDAPETDAPETDAPETDAPETDAPETDAPETDAPETDAPETDAPKAEEPKTEEPKTDDAEGMNPVIFVVIGVAVVAVVVIVVVVAKKKK